MIKRKFFIFFSLIFVTFGAQAQVALLDYPYLRHEFKVWLWADSFQVQIIEPKTKSTALIFVRYDVVNSKSSNNEKYRIIELEVETEAKKGKSVHPSITEIEEDVYAAALALNSLFLLNVSAINFYGPRDFDYDTDSLNVPEPVFLTHGYQDLDFLNQKPAPLPKEIDVYRIRKLIKTVLSVENLDLVEQTMKSDQNLMCSGFLK